MSNLLPYLVIGGMIITLIILGIGIVSLLIGGRFNAKYSNTLMRLRIVAQGVTILLFICLLIFH